MLGRPCATRRLHAVWRSRRIRRWGASGPCAAQVSRSRRAPHACHAWSASRAPPHLQRARTRSHVSRARRRPLAPPPAPARARRGVRTVCALAHLAKRSHYRPIFEATACSVASCEWQPLVLCGGPGGFSPAGAYSELAGPACGRRLAGSDQAGSVTGVRSESDHTMPVQRPRAFPAWMPPCHWSSAL